MIGSITSILAGGDDFQIRRINSALQTRLWLRFWIRPTVAHDLVRSWTMGRTTRKNWTTGHYLCVTVPSLMVGNLPSQFWGEDPIA